MRKKAESITPTSVVKKIFKGGIVLEVVGFIGCYMWYRKTNRDPEFRYKLYSHSSYTNGMLQTYYMIGETFNSELKTREQDLILWKAQEKSI